MENTALLSSKFPILAGSPNPSLILSRRSPAFPSLRGVGTRRQRRLASSVKCASNGGASQRILKNVLKKLETLNFASISSSSISEMSTASGTSQLPVPPPPSYIGSPLFWIGVGVGISALFSMVATKVKQYALQQAFKTMMGQAAPQNGQFSNAAFPQGSPFPFPPTPPPVSSTPSPSFSSIASPQRVASQSAVTVDVSATKVEATPPAEVGDEPEIKKEEKKYAFVDISPEEVLQKDSGYSVDSTSTGTSSNAGTKKVVSPNGAAVQQVANSSTDQSQSEERVVVLVIGGGGREHALCYALQRSPSCDAVFCAPGNAGITQSGNATCISDLNISDSSAVIAFSSKWGVGLVVIGPEAPLVAGLANDLVKAGIPTFGPSSEAAALEGSKDFMKKLCDKYDIPTAKYRTFTNASEAKQYIKEQGSPIVVKADGLAAGKGVIVAMTMEEAYEAIDSMLVNGAFGSAGSRVIVEEFLEGDEASFFALVDGENALPLESAQDHKRVGDGDTGPNTGGMGAYSPAPVLTKELQSVVMESIILPTVKGMAEEGCKFVGVLYAGLMIEKKSGLPKLIEYNVRFGDPECQVLMMRLESDLAQVLLAACRGELGNVTLEWSPGSAMVVVVASRGYPGAYQKGSVIRNLEEAELISPMVKIFHAGTALDSDGNFIATGGRVLGVTAKGKDIDEARDRAYDAVDAIDWPEGFFRRDIGWRALRNKQLTSHR